MTTKYRVYNELSEDEKAQIATEKQWHKRGYCPVENEGEHYGQAEKKNESFTVKRNERRKE